MTNPVRTCIGCGQVDDHPRHVVLVGADHAEVTWHMDCHSRAANCDVCASQIADANGATGDELRTHLVTKDG